ncbi:MAG TPA: hypothetical protein VME01_02205, partial [Solirubrobacteraceae bacterium]|nr:hypothetical protein [Solirubrobacteraceae bacterium]
MHITTDGMPHKLAHSAEEAANRLAEAVESGGSVMAKRASDAGDRAQELADQISDKVSHAQLKMPSVKTPTVKVPSVRAPKVNVNVRRPMANRVPRMLRRRGADALLKAQLAKTSRELAHESTELGEAVNSLNAVIK